MKIDFIIKFLKNSVFILMLVILLLMSGLYFIVASLENNENNIALQNNVKTDIVALVKGDMAAFTPIHLPYRAPQSVFYNKNGDEVRFDDFLGRVLLVNLWASWCGSCRAEMPYIDELQKIRQSSDFTVLTISLDQSDDDIEEFFTEYNITSLPAYIDKKLVLNAGFRSAGLPNTYIIDKDGYVVGKLSGPANWSSKEAINLIDYFIKKGSLTQRLSSLNQ